MNLFLYIIIAGLCFDAGISVLRLRKRLRMPRWSNSVEKIEYYGRILFSVLRQTTSGDSKMYEYKNKKPWQMTIGQYTRKYGRELDMTDMIQPGDIGFAHGKPFEPEGIGNKYDPSNMHPIYRLPKSHKAIVHRALSEGKLVPPRVLADYGAMESLM